MKGVAVEVYNYLENKGLLIVGTGSGNKYNFKCYGSPKNVKRDLNRILHNDASIKISRIGLHTFNVGVVIRKSTEYQ